MPTKDLGFRQSPNCNNGLGRKGWDKKADMIIMHITEGAFNGAVGWLCNTAAQTSSHFVTGQNGDFIQLVKLSDYSWCNGNSPSTIGQALNPLVKARPNDNANWYTFSLENEGFSYKDRFGVPTENQIEAIVECCKKIVNHIHTYNPTWRATRTNVTGHYDISSRDKASCPSPNFGEKFPFDRIINLINQYIDKKQGTVTPPVVTGSGNTGDGKAPLDTVAAAGIKVGSMVKVKPGSKTYSGGTPASFIFNNVYPVSSYSGDRVVLDSSGICSPFAISNLILVSNGIDVEKKEFKVGTNVKIKAGAKWDLPNNPAVPTWALPSVYIIDELSGTRAVLSKKGINSPIRTEHLDFA